MRRARRYLPWGLLVTGEMVTGRDPDWRMVLAPNRRVLIHRWCNPWPSDCRLSMFVAPWIPHQDFWHPPRHWLNPSAKICLSCQLFFFVPSGVFWPYFGAKSFFLHSLSGSFCSIFILFRTTNKEHRLNLSLSQAFSAFLPGTSDFFFATLKSPKPRNPGPSGPTLRRWRPNLTRKSWGIPCHKPSIWGWLGKSNKHCDWGWFMTFMIYEYLWY